jgi:hypothetical protein
MVFSRRGFYLLVESAFEAASRSRTAINATEAATGWTGWAIHFYQRHKSTVISKLS